VACSPSCSVQGPCGDKGTPRARVWYYDAAGELKATGARSDFARQWDLWKYESCLKAGFCKPELEAGRGAGGRGGRGGRGALPNKRKHPGDGKALRDLSAAGTFDQKSNWTLNLKNRPSRTSVGASQLSYAKL
jgi:hypothetical protein